MIDPPGEKLPLVGVQVAAEVRWKGGKIAGNCGISGELLKAGGEIMIRGMHVVLNVVWQTDTVTLMHYLERKRRPA